MSTSHYEDESESEFSYVQSDIIPRQKITSSQYSDDLPPPNLSSRFNPTHNLGRDSYMSSFSEYSANLDSNIAQPVSVKVVNEPLVPTINRSLSQKQQQEVRDQEYHLKQQLKNQLLKDQELKEKLTEEQQREKLEKRGSKKLDTTKNYNQLTPDYQYNTNVENTIPPRSSKRPKSEVIDTTNLQKEIDQYKEKHPLPKGHNKRISLVLSEDLDKLMERANSLKSTTFTFNDLPTDDSSSESKSVNKSTDSIATPPLKYKGLPPRPSVENLARARQASGKVNPPEVTDISDPVTPTQAKGHESEDEYHSPLQSAVVPPQDEPSDVPPRSPQRTPESQYPEDSPVKQSPVQSIKSPVQPTQPTFEPQDLEPTNKELKSVSSPPAPIPAPVLSPVIDRNSNRSSLVSSNSRINQTLPQPPMSDNESVRSNEPLIKHSTTDSKRLSSGYMPVDEPEYQLQDPQLMKDYSPKGEAQEFMKPQQVFDDEQGSSVNEQGYPGYPTHYPEDESFHHIRPHLSPEQLQEKEDAGELSDDKEPLPKTPEDVPNAVMGMEGLVTPIPGQTTIPGEHPSQPMHHSQLSQDKDLEEYYDIEEPQIVSKPARAKSVKDSTKHPTRTKSKKKRKEKTKSQQLKPFSYHTLINLLESINGTIIGEEFNQLNLPMKEKQLIEKIVDQLSRLTSDMVLDEQRYEIGIDRLERALRVLEGFM
ncbi:hypothetical protein CLIB1444_02S02454 [[Candida] jaroonii]|uniref:Uncharacterized protein n=1 Tax=[Candida] jaroonii TaxID=467808 RepID=A0ACA9Y2H5_9ASCO|nr:hypothetical protein CLIB1444_02S02454 [[Candida] jaroonii]